MQRNINKYRRALDEHNERLQSQEMLINIPVMQAVRNLVLIDQARTLQVALKTWKKFTCAMREKEHNGRMAKKLYRCMAEDIVKDCFNSASKSASLVLLESLTINESEEVGMMNPFNIQKWRRSRSTQNTTRLDGGTADGRISHFHLPAPNLSKYTPKSGNCHPKQAQHIERVITSKDMDTYWKAGGSRPVRYKLSNELFVRPLASESR